MKPVLSSCLFVLGLSVSVGALVMPAQAMAQSSSGTPDAQVLAQGKSLVASNGCAGCHGTTLAGGQVVAGWTAPGLNDDKRTGLGNWSAAEIAEYLRTGRNSYAMASGPMAGIITNITAKMSKADANAIAAYLKSLPGGETNIRPIVATGNPAMIEGGAVYADECSACHRQDGAGEAGLFPTLRGSAVVQAGNPATLLHVVLEGAQSVATRVAPTASAMPAFGKMLNDQQIADVLTYIRNSWGNAAAPVDKDAVATARKAMSQGS